MPTAETPSASAVLDVTSIIGQEVHTRVHVGGKLSNNKGINKQGGGLSAPALTEKDKQDLKTAIEIGVDYLAVSFPRSAADMQEARALLGEAGKEIGLVAKIERAEAVANDETLDAIIEASEAVMVARGDLGFVRKVGSQATLYAGYAYHRSETAR